MKNRVVCVFRILLLTVVLVSNSGSRRRRGLCLWMFYENSTCIKSKYLCDHGKCIHRYFHCNHRQDCGGRDYSDEMYCNKNTKFPSCPKGKRMCDSRCILEEWFCDGIPDCKSGEDEKFCDHIKLSKEPAASQRGVQWLYNQSKSKSTTDVWGSSVDKAAVALYMADDTFVKINNGTRKEIAYEVSIQLLSRLSQVKLVNIPSTDLASFINAFLVSCIDPRKFHGIDIVQELRNRVDKENFTNPYVLMSLCVAGDRMTESDKTKLIDTFRNKRRTFWTDMQAYSMMALACASKQQQVKADREIISELVKEWKLQQHGNGTVENLQTTALVLQALYSADPDNDPDHFDEKKALEQITSSQRQDGSFGNWMDAYFVLPVLNCKSLLHISSDHCKSIRRDEISTLVELAARRGPKKRVQYSLWIGDKKDLERYMVLRVPQNMSLYGIMEIAAEVDTRYRFEYVVKNRKPYINSISDIQDNPEKGQFWFLYQLKGGEPTPSQESPYDVMPVKNDHFLMWYRSGSWVDAKNETKI